MIGCLNVSQINLHHSCSASGILCKRLVSSDFDIALIQEPWTHRGKILDLSLKGHDIFYGNTCARPRPCIVVSSRLKKLLLASYLDSDNFAIGVNFKNQGHKDGIIFMSSYLSYEEKSPLSDKMKGLIEFCSKGNKKLVLNCDANAHHTVWGSTATNLMMSCLKTY